MRQLQQMKAFISLVGIPMVRQATYLQSPNTKTEIGKMLEIWPKRDIILVQSPLNLLQWLLVEVQAVDQSKCI